MNFGTLVINEQIFPISGIALSNGNIVFYVSIHGPQILPQKSEVRIHAPDGSLILVAPWVLTPMDISNLSKVTPDGITYIQLPVAVDSVVGWPK